MQAGNTHLRLQQRAFVASVPPLLMATQDQYERNKNTTLTAVREENIMRQSARAFVFFLLVVIGKPVRSGSEPFRELRQTRIHS